MKTRRVFAAECLLAAISGILVTKVAAEGSQFVPDPFGKRPMLAVWRDNDRNWAKNGPPSLRFAIWEDGTVLFAKEDKVQSGTIAPHRVALLKEQLASSGIFELAGTCYLVPDGVRLCLIAAVEGKTQMLFWDEVETPGYGINVDPKPRHLEFMRCWKLGNLLGRMSSPDVSHPVDDPFRPPDNWQLKKPVQSE